MVTLHKCFPRSSSLSPYNRKHAQQHHGSEDDGSPKICQYVIWRVFILFVGVWCSCTACEYSQYSIYPYIYDNKTWTWTFEVSWEAKTEWAKERARRRERESNPEHQTERLCFCFLTEIYLFLCSIYTTVRHIKARFVRLTKHRLTIAFFSACQRAVARNGGEFFFDKRRWDAGWTENLMRRSISSF